MTEPLKVQFPEFEFQSKDSLKKCKSFNSKLAKIYKSRDGYQAIAEAPVTVDGASYEQSFAKQEAKGQFIDTHLEEKNLLESTGDFVESLIDEAVAMVRENEANSNTAFARIRAEIDAYGLIWANDNQFDLFVRKSVAMKPFEDEVCNAQSYERAARNLVGAIRSRCNWIHDYIIAERSKLVPVG